MKFRAPSIALLVVFLGLSTILPANGADCTYAWDTADYRIAPYLETHAKYLSYQFRIPRGQKFSLRFRGDFPRARYMGYQLYDQETENPISSVSDDKIPPDAGHVNPYRPHQDRYAADRKYTLWAACANSSLADSASATLRLPCNEEKDVDVDLWFRVYAEEDARTLPPQITAFDENGQRPTECPWRAPKVYSHETSWNPFTGRVIAPERRGRVPLPLRAEGRVEFYVPSTENVGASADNIYAVSRLDGKPRDRLSKFVLEKLGVFRAIGDVAVIKFRPPLFPRARIGEDEEVRYWSICVSGETTETSDCLMDAEAKILADDAGKAYVGIVIGAAEDPQLRQAAERAGYNYLHYGEFRAPVLIYRQVKPSDRFLGSLSRVPTISREIANAPESISALTPYFASTTLGDHAPQGKQCWKQDFLRDFCGLRKDSRAISSASRKRTRAEKK